MVAKQRIVLLIGYKQDPHLGEVAGILESLSLHAKIFAPFSERDFLTYSFGDTASPILTVDGSEVSFDEVAGVWFRQKPITIQPSWSPLRQSAAAFKQKEWRVALYHLSSVLSDVVWMNPVKEQARISIKPNQLELAQLCGLTVPETRITNNIEDVLGLFDRYEKVVYKSLNTAFFPDMTGTLTNLITRETVIENQESVSKCPGIFQRFIEKEYELRVTLVEDDIFVVRINTPECGSASIDWRRAQFDDIFEVGDLDSTTEGKIRRFQYKSGLKFGAYDLIVSKDGLTYFLECNPAGQYLWLKDRCGIDVSPAIASFFGRNS